jgi:Pyruvate/2-oxoacid:ferredoxin oxidoreductase gamma subunit
MNQPSAIRNPQSALEKMNIQMIISGVGGQGVLLMTRIFAAFALQEGYPLIGFATAHQRFPFPHDKLRDATERATPERFREASLKIFEKGFAEGRKSVKT